MGKDAGFSKVSWFYFRPNPHIYWRLGSISGKTNILIGALVLFQAKPTYLLAPCFYFRQYPHTYWHLGSIFRQNQHTYWHLGSISGKTDILIVGKDAGFSKVSKARSLPSIRLMNIKYVCTRACQSRYVTATHCNILQHTATHCICLVNIKNICTRDCQSLFVTATHCSTLQRTANSLQHIASALTGNCNVS